MSENETTPNRQAPTSLWAATRAFLCIVFDLFGAPEDIARRHTLTLAQHQLILPWLRAGEALLRRLLLIEAALVAAEESSNGPPPSRRQIEQAGKTPAVRPRKLVEHDPEKPDEWRVSFRCLLDRRRPRRRETPAVQAKPPAGTPAVQVKFRSAWPLAERAEALLRVFNDPALFARRLAARLRRRAALAQRIATEAWSQFRDLVGHSLHDVLTEPILNAARVFAELTPNTS